MKEVNGRVQLAKIKRWEAIYLQRPTVYELWTELEENGEQKERLIRSSGSFLKRYQRKNPYGLLPCRERIWCLPRKKTGRSRMRRRGL